MKKDNSKRSAGGKRTGVAGTKRPGARRDSSMRRDSSARRDSSERPDSDTRSDSSGKRAYGERRAASGEESNRSERGKEKRYKLDYNEGLILEGRNAVLEALNHDRPIDKIYIKKGPVEGSITVIVAKAKEKGIVISEVAREKLDFMSQSGNHQGVIASCPAHDYVEVSDILEIAKNKGEEPFIVILDSITDPHNLGAIMRSAECSGAHGIIIPKRRSVSLTGIVSKTSAGAIEHVPVARVTNLSQAVDELKKQGVWICSSMTHGRPLFKADMKGPIAIVIGSEGEGVSKLLEKKSDFVVSIPMYGEIESLNASVAAGLIMYEVVRQRKFS